MSNNLLVLTGEPEWDEFETTLNAFKLPDLNIIVARNESEIENNIDKCNIILANPPIAKNYINRASNLVWMQSIFAGIDALIASDLRSNYILTNVRNTYGDVMAEYVFAYILMFHKKVLENIEWQKERIWNQLPYKTIGEKTIGILGTGSIGKHIAKVSKVFGMKTFGINSIGSEMEYFDKTSNKADSATHLGACDFLVSVLPNTANTKHFVNKELLTLLNPECIFINIGRGDNVNEVDLIEALQSRKLKAAVLDVFKTEPLPTSSLLWSLPNVYITPHVSGYSLSEKIFEIFKENYLRFHQNRDLLHQVNFLKGY